MPCFQQDELQSDMEGSIQKWKERSPMCAQDISKFGKGQASRRAWTFGNGMAWTCFALGGRSKGRY